MFKYFIAAVVAAGLFLGGLELGQYSVTCPVCVKPPVVKQQVVPKPKPKPVVKAKPKAQPATPKQDYGFHFKFPWEEK